MIFFADGFPMARAPITETLKVVALATPIALAGAVGGGAGKA